MNLPREHADYPHIPGYLACHRTPNSAECEHNGTATSDDPTDAELKPTDAQVLGITVIPRSQRRLTFPSAATLALAHGGEVFAGSSHRTADELAAVIVRWAIANGASRQDLPDLGDAMLEVLAFKSEWWQGGTGPGVLWMTDSPQGGDLAASLTGELLYQAVDYLNEPANGVCPNGYAFDLDDGLYLAPIEEF